MKYIFYANHYIFYISLGLIPSIIWLIFYLKKDIHPESKKTILKIFLGGILAAILAAIMEIIIEKTTSLIIQPSSLLFIIIYFLGAALVEEFSKYFIVKKEFLKKSEFDEPVDAMIYMITSALGFAALENIFTIFPGLRNLSLTEATSITTFRFLGATFLHALCSGTIGYFLALSILNKKKIPYLSIGIILASILHGLYNFSIINLNKYPDFLFLIIFILISLFLFVSSAFKELKKIKSICVINKNK